MKQKTILFDINETVLNLDLLKPKFEKVFNDQSVVTIWFSMLLHSSTVAALTGVKSTFATLASDMLENVATRRGITLTDQARNEILTTFANLAPHNDIKSALTKLKKNGYRTVAFSNSSLDLITQQIKNADLSDYFDQVISVESTGSFKPDPKVYQFVAEQLKQPIATLRLVATHDWDTHGAISAGMLAAYINRTGAPYHPQYKQPKIIADNMNKLVEAIIISDKHSE
ncbi:haloacid dehalogenase type II [Psychromonas algicola]|uniref:haloacid dehalogenase type II n=1 Tax=Psychromonas algicola TaxID=2555642 RepID=UPI001068321F|nr:haloacid dehalogenase type II [Psychromonas sp. RZ5]TEW50177.1 haloacid dehalogenase type II [Psychromonas sp. RZ5]